MAKRSTPEILAAKSSFWTTRHGDQVLVNERDMGYVTDPLVIANPKMFVPLPIRFAEGAEAEEVLLPHAVEPKFKVERVRA
jgi:hypothetical protein